jgi:hypothetical protein
MEQSKALNQLTETADLVGMVQALLANGTAETVSPAAMSGIRLTLRTIQQQILESHDCLAKDMVNRARARLESNAIMTPEAESFKSSDSTPPLGALRPSMLQEMQNIKAQRKDLRSSLEKITER